MCSRRTTDTCSWTLHGNTPHDSGAVVLLGVVRYWTDSCPLSHNPAISSLFGFGHRSAREWLQVQTDQGLSVVMGTVDWTTMAREVQCTPHESWLHTRIWARPAQPHIRTLSLSLREKASVPRPHLRHPRTLPPNQIHRHSSSRCPPVHDLCSERALGSESIVAVPMAVVPVDLATVLSLALAASLQGQRTAWTERTGCMDCRL